MLPETAPLDCVLHIADLHFWRVTFNPFQVFNKRLLGMANVWFRRRHEFVMDRAEEFADQAAATGINHVLLTGDFTSTSLDEEFAMARAFVRGLRQRGLAVSLLPGNHDVYTFGSARKKRFEHYLAEFLPQGGYPALTLLPGGTGLLLAPTARPNLLSARGRITDAALAEAARLLSEGPPTVIVAGHYPLLFRTSTYSSDPYHRLRNAAALRTALAASQRRILYVCGHVHRFSFVQDPLYPTLQHVSTGAFFRNDPKRDTRGEFGEIAVYPDRWRVFRHRLAARWDRHEAFPEAGGATP